MNEAKEILLNGMSFGAFSGYFLCAIGGVIVILMSQIYSSVKYDKRSPDKFNLVYFLKTASPRVVMGIIVMWASIVYYGELSVKLLNSEEPLKITGLIAFLLGIGIDSLIKGVLDLGKHSTSAVISKINGK